MDVWMDEKSGSGNSAYELRVQSSELHVTAGSLQALETEIGLGERPHKLSTTV